MAQDSWHKAAGVYMHLAVEFVAFTLGGLGAAHFLVKRYEITSLVYLVGALFGFAFGLWRVVKVSNKYVEKKGNPH